MSGLSARRSGVYFIFDNVILAFGYYFNNPEGWVKYEFVKNHRSQMSLFYRGERELLRLAKKELQEDFQILKFLVENENQTKLEILAEENKESRKYNAPGAKLAKLVEHEDKTTTLHQVFKTKKNGVELILSLDRWVDGCWVALDRKVHLLVGSGKLTNNKKEKLLQKANKDIENFKIQCQDRKRLYRTYYAHLNPKPQIFGDFITE